MMAPMVASGTFRHPVIPQGQEILRRSWSRNSVPVLRGSQGKGAVRRLPGRGKGHLGQPHSLSAACDSAEGDGWVQHAPPWHPGPELGACEANLEISRPSGAWAAGAETRRVAECPAVIHELQTPGRFRGQAGKEVSPGHSLTTLTGVVGAQRVRNS